MEFDEVNNLEEQFYQEGFKEGQEESALESLREGKEYGLQTGFQKFILVGQIHALVELMQPVFGISSVHLTQLKDLVASISVDNDYNAVIAMDKTMSKIRNKVRILSTLADKQVTLQQLEDLGNVITGLAEENKKQVNMTDLGNEGVW